MVGAVCLTSFVQCILHGCWFPISLAKAIMVLISKVEKPKHGLIILSDKPLQRGV